MGKRNSKDAFKFKDLIDKIDDLELRKLRISAKENAKIVKEQGEIERLELMDKYWLNHMNKEEKLLFEERLKTDEILKSEFKEFKKTMAVVKKSAIEKQMVKTLKKLAKI